MEEVLEYLVKAIVENPNKVSIERIETDRGTVFEVRVDPEDLGRVIGRQGRIAKAIRTVMKAAGSKFGERALVEIVE